MYEFVLLLQFGSCQNVSVFNKLYQVAHFTFLTDLVPSQNICDSCQYICDSCQIVEQIEIIVLQY